MILDTSLQELINQQLITDNMTREMLHTPSGVLSASMLFQPLRFQIMKSIGIPTKRYDPYTLGKFKRGNDVEDWFINSVQKLNLLIEKQKKVYYKNVIGHIDLVLNSDKMQYKKGIMPHEVKSVTNAKLARIKKTGVDYHYQLQACFYALAMKTNYYAIDIISAEDLRINTYIFETKDLKTEIDELIKNYDEAMHKWKTKKLLPKLEPHPKATWTINPNYALFDEIFINMSDKQIIKQTKQ